ncbi:MAG: diguanylate cyclase [Candidatus Koribacter versatilis]|uniref:Diguanylate cyclase n=1 Tax=Candidatus Korobacter versatilis TaxID=658062 RepID=A0A932A9M7_9BACT|nr:diguanylate cyclase [Candidatus Koribacter versatilis]
MKKPSKPAKSKAKAKPAAKHNVPDLREIVESLNDVIYARDVHGVCTYISPAVERVFGHKPADLVGKTFAHVIHPDDREYVAGIARTINGGEAVESEHRILDQQGRPRWVNVKAHPTFRNGKFAGAHGVFFDVTERKVIEEALLESQHRLEEALAKEQEAATTDALTHLANRRAFYSAGETEVRRARRYQRPLALAYLDLDNFKAVNDGLGHEVGDALLVTVAALVRGNVRSTDLAARIGGDEFAVLLPETGDVAAKTVMEKVSAALRETFFAISTRLELAAAASAASSTGKQAAYGGDPGSGSQGGTLIAPPSPDVTTSMQRPVGCSIGVLALAPEHQGFEALIREADQRMYRMKRGARKSAAR